LLQPQWGDNEELVDQEGRDLFIMLDISRSMLAQDVKPNRLEFAKLKIRRLLELLKTDRVGLVLFSSSAIIQCPLTSDHQAFNAYLQEINEQVIGRGSTTIDVALIKVIELFKKMGREKNKLAFLITDGEDFSTNLNAAQQRALKEDIHLFAMGVGTTEGAPIPKLDDQGRYIGHEVDATGAIALSALNEVKLQSLCALLHGTYVKASYQDNDIIKIADRVLEFEKEKYSEQKVSLYDDQYPWPLALTTLFLALEWIL
jgi:Ca-activated chloride channel family protein